MSEFSISQVADGRFELTGAMSFETADRILRASERLFRGHARLCIDFAGVDDADSAGLALLIEWKARARRDGGEIHYSGLPQSILAIAKTAEVDHLL
jgi:phospholipid transport system transporter-binding protein